MCACQETNPVSAHPQTLVPFGVRAFSVSPTPQLPPSLLVCENIRTRTLFKAVRRAVQLNFNSTDQKGRGQPRLSERKGKVHGMSLECSLSVSGSGSNGQSNGNDTQREKDSMRELANRRATTPTRAAWRQGGTKQGERKRRTQI